jgi:hypothetical protein
MTRSSRLLAYLSSFIVVVPLSASLGGCSEQLGSKCMSSDDCPDEAECVFGGGESVGVCIDPNEDHGALPEPPSTGGLLLTVNKDIDILFVIDNSGSMGEEQAILANNFGSFIEVLEAEDVEANYRIGITTTDNGNPWCPPGETTPEAGNLVLRSCKDRLGDFLFNNGAVDVQDLACNDICTLSSAELEILPTTTDFDPTAKPRPWLENIEGVKNIPSSTSTADAFKCFGPQGINGCGFESPLESMYLALRRAENADEDEYGLIRAQAILAVVIVTDEEDCSYNEEYAEIFAADGNKVFWSDPTAAFPTSAVCWNAGVECIGDPSNYDSCDPVNKDVNGNSTAWDDAAVMHPMSRYYGLLDGLEQQKQDFNANQEVIVALIGGVDASGNVVYADVSATDPEFQDNFGIGPGCTAPSGGPEPVKAVPPVRIRDVVNRYTEGNMFSICNDDYSEAFDAIAERISDQIQPACYSKCAEDTNPATELVEPECIVEESVPGAEDSVALLECQRDASGAYVIDASTNDYTMPSADVNVCYALLTDDAGLTSSTADDMSPECIDRNFNVEFEIARRTGFPAAGGTSVGAGCYLAEFPDVSCPGIGG